MKLGEAARRKVMISRPPWSRVMQYVKKSLKNLAPPTKHSP